jgi:DNA-binding GntR family transcriptional regulator
VPGASEEPVQEGGGRSTFAQARLAPGSGSRPGEPSRSATTVLADRIAASLVHHEPGWRLPRHTALARRYNVSTAEIDAAVEELATRHLVRRLPDGQLYRVSPAEYLIPIEGVPGLTSRADPMGGQITLRSRQASWRQVPEDIGWALRIPPADPVGVIRVQWAANGEPAAFCTTYLLKDIAAPFISAQGSAQGSAAAANLTLLPITAPPAQPDPEDGELTPIGAPRAVHVEMQPPPPSVARSLRLAPGQPAALVTVRFNDPEDGRPVALTVAVLRPDLFRIVVEGGGQPLADGEEGSFSGAWTHAVEDWEP